MALPPTVIYDYLRSTSDATFEALKKAGLLREDALGRKDEFIRKLEGVKAAYFSKPDDGMTGPNLDNLTADALQEYLNDAGQDFYLTPKFFQPKREEGRIRVQKVRSRLRALLKRYGG